jgi:transposase InsO family protein
LVEAGIAPSIGTVRDSLDNALMESTIGLYKTEIIGRQLRTWSGATEVETATAGWVIGSTLLGSTRRSITSQPRSPTNSSTVRSDQLPNRGSCVSPGLQQNQDDSVR